MRRKTRMRADLACLLTVCILCLLPSAALAVPGAHAGPEAAAARAIALCNRAIDAGARPGCGEWARGEDGYLVQSAQILALPADLVAAGVRDEAALARYRAHDYVVALEYAVRASRAPFLQSAYLYAGIGGARPDELLPAPCAVLADATGLAARRVSLSWPKGRGWARFSARRGDFVPVGSLSEREKGLLRCAARFLRERQGGREIRALYLLRLDGGRARLPEAVRQVYRSYRYVVYAEARGDTPLEPAALWAAGVRPDGGMEHCASADDLRAWSQRIDLLDGARILAVNPASLSAAPDNFLVYQ